MKCKFVFFDCDGVLTFDDTWSRFNALVGLPNGLDRKWFADFYAGRISYKEWIQNLETFYKRKRLDKEKVVKVLHNLSVNPEATEIIEYLKRKFIPVAIISSGFDLYVHEYAQLLD